MVHHPPSLSVGVIGKYQEIKVNHNDIALLHVSTSIIFDELSNKSELGYEPLRADDELLLTMDRVLLNGDTSDW